MKYRSGDINFFACCMAVGIAPDSNEPATLFHSDDGKDYLSFNMDGVSQCGMHFTKELSKAWKNREEFANEYPCHPFLALMDFSKEALGSRTKLDWMNVGAKFLGIPVRAFTQAYDNIGELETNAPESPVSYIACFIANRFAAIRWAKDSVPKIAISKGKSMLLMDVTLTKSKQEFLTSHL